MTNKAKTKRNAKIIEYHIKGYRTIAIARMFHISLGAVNMVIVRERKRAKKDAPTEHSDI